MYTQTNNVNIKPKSYLPEFHVSQNDVGRTLTAHLVSDEGDISIPIGATVTMAGTKPSGLGYTVTGTIDGSDVSFDTDAVMTDEPGRIVSEIRIVQGNTVIGTTNVVLSIEPNPHPDDTTDGQREPLINEITALLHAIEEQAEQVADNARAVEQAMDAWTSMTAEAETLPAGSEASASYSEGVLSLGIPAGPEGAPGQDGQDGVGIASVQLNSDYTLTITLTDGRTYTTTSIRGEQGETGLTPDFSIGSVTTLAPGSQATATITGTDEEPVLNLGIPKGDPGEVSIETLAKVMVSDTTSGTIASFADGSDVLPAKSVLVTLAPKQSGSGTPSPSNVRPISGWDEVETNVTGVNVWDEEWELGGYNTTTGEPEVRTDAIRSKNYVHVLPSTSYYVKCSATMVICYYDADKNYVGYAEKSNSVFAVPNNACYIRFRMATNYGTTYNHDICINYPSTDHEYHAYNGHTYTTDLPQTVYGGTLDVVSGVLTVDRAMIVLDGTEAWGKDGDLSGYHRFYVENNDIKKQTNYIGHIVTNACEVVNTYAYFAGFSGEMAVTAYSIMTNLYNYLYLISKSLSSVADVKAYLASNPLQVVYELATPTTIQCDPQTVQTLIGDNNVWGGSAVVVDYYADTKLYIEKMLGA